MPNSNWDGPDTNLDGLDRIRGVHRAIWAVPEVPVRGQGSDGVVQSVGQFAPGSGVRYELELCWVASLQTGVGVEGLCEELGVEEGLWGGRERGEGGRLCNQVTAVYKK